MSNTPQNYKNHKRVDPGYHYFLAPVALITLIIAIVHLTRHPNFCAAWGVVLAIALIVMVLKIRTYPLKAQDRVIRMEERMRLAAMLPETQWAYVDQLSAKQLAALRFASDGELPALAERAWKEKLSPKQIKQAIQLWRPDTFRV